jgi:hypothetical protein
MDKMWDKLIAAEEAQDEGIIGYAEDNIENDEDQDSENEEQDYDDIDKEFADFSDEPQYLTSYSQMEHTSFGGGIGGKIGGKYSKLEKMIQAQTVSKEDLYLAKFKAIATNWTSQVVANSFAEEITLIERYWLKNPEALIGALMLKKGNNALTTAMLEKTAKTVGVPTVDLYRYYKLF